MEINSIAVEVAGKEGDRSIGTMSIMSEGVAEARTVLVE